MKLINSVYCKEKKLVDNECFIEKILKLISLKQEGDYWDFKKQWYTNKSDLLHDIICMANNISSDDGYIIIGVDEESDYSILDVTNDPKRKRTQDIVCFLRNSISFLISIALSNVSFVIHRYSLTL